MKHGLNYKALQPQKLNDLLVLHQALRMKFNPHTQEVFTDTGHFLKKLHCPYRIRWQVLQQFEESPRQRTCSECNHQILDTAQYDDTELLAILTSNPETCLKIDINQPNVETMYHGFAE